MSLSEDVSRYTELSGNDGLHTPIGIVGAYLDGYEKGKVDAQNWISVLKRLPKDEDYKPFAGYEGVVFELLRNGEISFGWYYESTENWANMDNEYADVVAWMPPPPKPWEGGKE